MATSLAGLSASVTRILSLTGFPKELKTKDIQSAFAEWENSNGGFKIKWRDDTSLLIVFQDASIGMSRKSGSLTFHDDKDGCPFVLIVLSQIFSKTDCNFTYYRS